MSTYDIIHFEALGAEAQHLQEETVQAQVQKELPGTLRYLITSDPVQQFLKKHPEITLPVLITTKTHSVLPPAYLQGPKKSIVTRSAGYDHFEHLAALANIASLREYCVNAVAQTAVKFLYAAAGQLNQYTVCAQTFERHQVTSFIELNKDRVATVFGVGKIGKRIYELLEANGLSVQGVDIRQAELDGLYQGGVRFVGKKTAIANSDIIINAMNLTQNPRSRFYNAGYFAKEYLAQAKPGLIFINVTRGDIAPESGLLELYTKGQLRGIGLDTFTNEAQFAKMLTTPMATLPSPDLAAARILLDLAINRTANIYVQPHQAFNSDVASAAKAREAIKHIIAWYRNDGRCFAEQLPYYQA